MNRAAFTLKCPSGTISPVVAFVLRVKRVHVHKSNLVPAQSRQTTHENRDTIITIVTLLSHTHTSPSCSPALSLRGHPREVVRVSTACPDGAAQLGAVE